MDATTVAKIIARRDSSIALQPNKGWMKLTNAHGAIVLVSQPNKGGTCTRAHLSGWGYTGLPAGVQIPASALKPIADNGAVSLEVDLTKAPDALARLLAALPSIRREEDPRRKPRARRGSGQAPNLVKLIADQTEAANEAFEGVDEVVFAEDAEEATEEASSQG